MPRPAFLDELFDSYGNVGAFLLADTFGEMIGSRLATAVSRRLRSEFNVPPGVPTIEGPHFVYGQNPTLFPGRRGCGPLRIAWDTNLLIDYFEYGRALWECESMPEIAPGIYGEELEALQIAIAVAVLRDIRFYVLPPTLLDAKRSLDARRVGERRQAFGEFVSALSVVESSSDDTPPPFGLRDAELQRALARVPSGHDRALVEEALRRGIHVFLTRDDRVNRASEAFRPLGLFIGSPLDLLEELSASGALFCLMEPRSAYWPLPSQERVAHLYHATLQTTYKIGSSEVREILPFGG